MTHLVNKVLLRKEMLSKRENISENDRKNLNSKIVKNIESLDIFCNSKLIGMYFSDGFEVDVIDLFYQNNKKRFAFPRYSCLKKEYEMVEVTNLHLDLVRGKFGLLEPKENLLAISKEDVEKDLLFIVPALACDIAGNRLGRGGGFYDRLLAGVEQPKIGVVYDFQIVETLLTEIHDIKMDIVISENREAISKLF